MLSARTATGLRPSDTCPKALNYVLKDVATKSDDAPIDAWRHQVTLGDAVRRMRCCLD